MGMCFGDVWSQLTK